MPDALGKFSIFEVGSAEEEIAWGKRKLEEKPTYKQRKRGGNNTGLAQLTAINSILDVILRQNREILDKLDSLEKRPAGASTSSAGKRVIK